MDEMKLKFMSWVGGILIVMGGMAALTATSYNWARMLIMFSLLIPGLILEFSVFVLKRRK